jgi:serine protease Do/serine protease DegQ
MMNKTKILLIFFLGLTGLSVHAALPPQADGLPLPSLAPMLEYSMPAVVNISTTTNVRQQENPLMNDPVFRRYFKAPKQNRQKNSLGSGR